MEKLTMTVKEMGKRLGISTGKAYELAKSEGFPVIYIGRRMVVPTEGLMRWIETQTNAPQHFEVGRR
ncbi:MAG: helix-turn-helix domain-containing protein [Defluviitaleaceae bacterium]|nr:helix-turn-helix domain-containing protein [Defluviitaleaceae bacterium]